MRSSQNFQPRIVAEPLEPATEMMRAYAGLHPDQTRRHIREPYLHLIARPFLTQHNCAAIVQADNVERVLTDIDARLRQSQSVLS
jgi:hypothetical protein